MHFLVPFKHLAYNTQSFYLHVGSCGYSVVVLRIAWLVPAGLYLPAGAAKLVYEVGINTTYCAL